jgi:hypothetical protein
MYNFIFEDINQDEITGIDFETVKRGYQTITQSFFVRNTGTDPIVNLILQPIEHPELQEGIGIETYNAMLLSVNNIDFLEKVVIGLAVGATKEIYCKYRPPSFSELDAIPALRQWGLAGIIQLNTNIEKICD